MDAETIAVVAQNLSHKALSLAAEEFSSFLGLMNDLENLAGESEVIQALAEDAGHKTIHSEDKESWLKRLRSVVCNADDMLEDFNYEVLRRKVPQKKWRKVRSFYSPITNLVVHLKMVRKIKDIYSQLKCLKEEGIVLGLNPAVVAYTRSSDSEVDRFTSPLVDNLEIRGRDDDVIRVVGMLLTDERYFEVIGIVGMGGSGKTTVAKLVFKDEKVANYFHHRIWICVDDDFQVERLLNEMVQSITGENLYLTNRVALIKKLQETLIGKRCLLVLDDVWNEDQEKWEAMANDLREIGCSAGTKVMVTTRILKVASIMNASSIHRLGLLSDVNSWSLFRRRAFAEGGAVETPALVAIGQRMVEKCNGLPLSIMVLGGLLYSKKDEAEWLSIENSDMWSSSTNQDVPPSIKLSFNNLPSSSLKHCFAYCSIYQEDTVIEREYLIQLWMAQGFLNPPQGAQFQMEDLGSEYFEILLQNYLLLSLTNDDSNKIKYCRMHDIVHEFAQDISRDLSLISNEREMVDFSQGISSKLRTLYAPFAVIGNSLIKFGFLRSLILCDEGITELPSSIGRLKHLRFIDIERSGIRTLPASYKELYNLQTIRVHLVKRSTIVLGTLINLRHIYLPFDDAYPCMLVGIRQLSHLQTLPYFTVSFKNGCKIEELGLLNNLRGKLILYGLDKVKNSEEAQKANLSRKLKVDRLELHWAKERKEFNDVDVVEGLRPPSNLKGLKITNFKGSRFPSWMMMTNDSLLYNLVEFTLDRCDAFELPTLGHLPHLKIVDIRRMKNVKSIGTEFYSCSNLDSTTTAFPALKKLSLNGMESLKVWLGAESISSVKEAFPHLTHLSVVWCENLTHLPSLQGLKYLEVLEVRYLDVSSIPDLHCGLSLRSLFIEGCEKLAALPRALESCTSLESIRICNCPALQGLDGYGLERFPDLTSLYIGGFSQELDYFPWPHTVPRGATTAEKSEDVQIGFASLKKLTLWGWPKLTSLPEQLVHLPSLSFLSIQEFEGLEALPEWLGDLQSLQFLNIWGCENIESLPSAEAMQRLTNLQELSINLCVLLKERCTNRLGQEWQKIAGIPKIMIDYDDIQSHS